MTPSLTVVMPAYNEAATLQEIADRVLASPWTTELLIVDDASLDDTFAIAGELAERDDRVRVLRQPANAGKGAALARGFAEATAELW